MTFTILDLSIILLEMPHYLLVQDGLKVGGGAVAKLIINSLLA